MARFGKPDATGRSSGSLGGRQGKLRRPPAGEPWAWITAELLNSAAWRGLSINARRLIDFLLREHCNHAGRENGRLVATHEQLKAYGMTAESIRRAIEQCKRLGLIEHQRGGRWAGTNAPSRFRLTFYADAEGNPATDDWKRLGAGRQNQKATLESRSTVLRKPEVPTARQRRTA